MPSRTDSQHIRRAATVAFLTSLIALIGLAAHARADDDLPPNRGGNGEEVRELNDPLGECHVEPLDGNAQVKLTGKIKTLRVDGLNGAAVLDASELRAREVIVKGTCGGGTTLKLNAPGGTVQIAGDLKGAAALEINAPDGSVILGSDQTTIGEGAKLHITTRDLAVRGDGKGGARIWVLFTGKGTLKFTRLDEGAQIAYSKAAETDPDPKIDAGEIHGGASCRASDDNEALPPALRPAKDAFPADAKSIGPGLILTDGTVIAAQIISADDGKAVYRRPDADHESVPLAKVAVVLLAAIPEAKRDALDHDSPGLLLRTGDFIDGSLKGIDKSQVTVSSLIFGLRRVAVDREAVAVVIQKPDRGKKAP